jgi:adenine-specific DNA-methyltransferase
MEQIKKGNQLAMSEDILTANIVKLKELFPELVTEGKIDFESFRSVFGDEVEEGEEYYRFTWAGKANAKREAQKPSTGTLRPAPEESVDWETTKNIYIEGDNLEVLKLMQKGYADKVKMIYIDPPYNTGKDFVYKDNYKDNLRNYQEVTGQLDEDGNRLSTNSDSDGRYHSNWLNMMYPRLRLARNLLKEDGVIFMSIDDCEIDNLMKIGNEIFGEDNFVGNIIWKKKTNGNNMGIIPSIHDYLVTFSKTINGAESSLKGFPLSQEYLNKKYQNPDNDPLGPWTTMDLSANHKGPHFSIMNPKTKEIHFPAKGRYWVFNEKDVLKKIEDGRIIFGKSGEGKPIQKKYLKERESFHKRADSLFLSSGLNADGSKQLSELLQPKLFDHPKPSSLIEDLIRIQDNKGEIILDFFSGSSSTAHAVLKLNAEDRGDRSYIQVQLPEPTEEKSQAYLAGYKTISEIGKERIRRAAKKIAEEYPEKAKDLDLGFKVFKLDTSNIKGWDGNPDNLDESLFDTQDNIKTDRTEHDVLYEILLKYGLDLTLPIEEKQIAGKTIFSVGYGALFICLADTITNAVAQGIGEWKEELQPEVCRVVFKDSGFTDVEKTNSVQTLKHFGITEIKSI